MLRHQFILPIKVFGYCIGNCTIVVSHLKGIDTKGRLFKGHKEHAEDLTRDRSSCTLPKHDRPKTKRRPGTIDVDAAQIQTELFFSGSEQIFFSLSVFKLKMSSCRNKPLPWVPLRYEIITNVIVLKSWLFKSFTRVRFRALI